jgi:4-hydroxy-3-polyprenylbenzoate decarboxylase
MLAYALAITGASGAPYARRTIQGLVQAGHRVMCVTSAAGRRVLEVEESLRLTGVPAADAPNLRRWAGVEGSSLLTVLDERDVAAPIASGSYPIAGMAVVPCSTGTLARIAHGISGGLIERAADVCLKERRKLVLVPRETPLSLVHIRNMAAVTEAGAVVLPAMPGFYHRPQSIGDLVDFVAARILAQLGVDAVFARAWHGPEGEAHDG